jgi:hypothetical protein
MANIPFFISPPYQVPPIIWILSVRLNITKFSEFIYPGIIVVFGLGLLWKRASSNAAVWTSILTIPMGILFKVAFPDMPFQTLAFTDVLNNTIDFK